MGNRSLTVMVLRVWRTGLVVGRIGWQWWRVSSWWRGGQIVFHLGNKGVEAIIGSGAQLNQSIELVLKGRWVVVDRWHDDKNESTKMIRPILDGKSPKRNET
ncbi:hypothetical protein LXL04_023985 [Taraxacum kok-saghyz]